MDCRGWSDVSVLAGCPEGGQTGDAADDDGTGSVAQPDFRAELLDMQEWDRVEPSGEEGTAGSAEQTKGSARSSTNMAGPHPETVGADGATAARLIAQHADLDPTFRNAHLSRCKGTSLTAGLTLRGRLSPGPSVGGQGRATDLPNPAALQR